MRWATYEPRAGAVSRPVGEPRPRRGRRADRERFPRPDQRQPEQRRFFRQLLQPPVVRVAGRTEAEVGEPAGVAVDQRLDPEPLREPDQLTATGRPDREIDE